MFDKQTLEEAHKHCRNNFNEIFSSELCGCFYCKETFKPKEINTFVDNGKTAICPYCDIDSVIGSQSGYEITNEFLDSMHDCWFATCFNPITGEKFKIVNGKLKKQ